MNKPFYYIIFANKEWIKGYATPRDVYYGLRENGVDHDTAANAESWCEIPEGECYEGENFIIALQEVSVNDIIP